MTTWHDVLRAVRAAACRELATGTSGGLLTQLARALASGEISGDWIDCERLRGPARSADARELLAALDAYYPPPPPSACPPQMHAALDLPLRGRFIGRLEGSEPLDLYTCPICRSTVSRPVNQTKESLP